MVEPGPAGERAGARAEAVTVTAAEAATVASSYGRRKWNVTVADDEAPLAPLPVVFIFCCCYCCCLFSFGSLSPFLLLRFAD